MAEEVALVLGIRDNPLDDAVRLIYADWLDDRGRTAEAEYLRLVAAQAATPDAVNVAGPEAVHLIDLARALDSTWREAVGSRFDLWFDGYRPDQKIGFIKHVRHITSIGLAEAKAFSESLPKVLGGGLPFEEAIGRVESIRDVEPVFRIVPATETPSRGLLRRDVTLLWHSWNEYHESETSPDPGNSRIVLVHLRRLLLSQAETAPLADRLPNVLDPNESEFAITLLERVLFGEAARLVQEWRDRLFGSEAELRGERADPPFVGTFSVTCGY